MKVCSVCYRCCDDDVFTCTVTGHSTFIEECSWNHGVVTGNRLDRLLSSDAPGDTYRAANLAGPRYFYSPEHFDATKLDRAADLYGLGVLLSKILAVDPLFHATHADAILRELAAFDVRALLTHTLMDSFRRTRHLRLETDAAFARQLGHIEQLIRHSAPPVISIPSVVNKGAAAPQPRLPGDANPTAAIPPIMISGRSSSSSRFETIGLVDEVPAIEAPVMLVNDPLPAAFVVNNVFPQYGPFPDERGGADICPAFEPFTSDWEEYADIPLVEEISWIDDTDYVDPSFPPLLSASDEEPASFRCVSRFVVDLTQDPGQADEPLIFSQYSDPRSRRFSTPLMVTLSGAGFLVLVVSVLAIGAFLSRPQQTPLPEKIADRVPRREKTLLKSAEPKIVTIESGVNTNAEFAVSEDSRDTHLNDQTIEEYLSRISDPDSSYVKRTATLQAALLEKSDENQISQERQDNRTKPNELKTRDDRFETILITPGSTTDRTSKKPVPKRNETNITSRPRIVKGRLIP